MRYRLIIATSVLGLLAGPALAQTSSSSTPPAGSAPGSMTTPRTTPGAPANAPAAATAPRTPEPDPMSQEDIAQIKGSAVYGSDGKKIGDVSTLLMDPSSKKIDRLVINQGGLLGVGAHRVALPVSDFKWDGDKDAFTIAKTNDELKSMPDWKTASAGASAQPSSGSSAPATPPASSKAGTSGSSTSE